MSRRYDRRRKPYGLGMLLVDVVLTLLTGGLWFIVVLIRALNNTSR